MKVLETRTDIEFLVNTFYERVKADPLLSPIFAHVDWATHLPVMYNFWSSMMLGNQSYRGNPFQKHIGLSLTMEHFNRWLALFVETADTNFMGDKAEELKNRARDIAGVFQYKLGLIR